MAQRKTIRWFLASNRLPTLAKSMINHVFLCVRQAEKRGRDPMRVTTRPGTRNLFAVTDSMDVATLASLFAEDAQVVFGNSQPLVGVDEIRTGLTAFFETIAGLNHE